jgi:hypothetical protein
MQLTAIGLTGERAALAYAVEKVPHSLVGDQQSQQT